MKLLVTGGAGFIGSQFIRYMSAKYPEYRIVNLDKLTYAGNLDNLKELDAKANYEFVRGDIADGGEVRKLIGEGGFDAVVNFAAESHVDRSIEDASIFVRTNVLGTQTLLEAARQAGVGKFVQISTDEVYGTLGENGYFTERTPLAPNSPYSASKAGADLLVRAYYETYGMNVNITRCSNNYGPYHFPEKLIPLLITNALQDKPIPVYGDGLNVRDWLHVRDHAAAIDRVLHGGKPGEVYNVGGHNERTNLDIVRFVLTRLGKPDSLITFVADRLGHDRRYAIDATKIREELGWEPSIFLEQGLAETVDWFVDNRDWWTKSRIGENNHGA
ncbi:dTDP-glucose 4,6-dehydratase [Cohnella sp. AR92]|uniref:dTDP-glucose 4,6-dehydratase n=1 Tax=Cohnella sp. AR92 TaxID=648716 RepID=UPI000F8D634D|nr:dTDP-glucose 4,6-dehydratase [Cohnella sp. AR92]RUS45294.1 dTDP-glucose 4,6-dehydratase [Cohnella sp. AR92]